MCSLRMCAVGARQEAGPVSANDELAEACLAGSYGPERVQQVPQTAS